MSVIALACGSRSGILPPQGSGAGGTAGAGLGGSGGASGGGTSGDCTTLVQVQPTPVIPRPAMHADSVPALVRSSADGELVTIAFARESVDPPGTVELRHATFDPWVSWAETVASTTFVTNTNVLPLAGFRIGTSTENHFSVLAKYEDSLFFSPAVTADAGESKSLAPFGAGLPAFVNGADPDQHLVGWLDEGNALFASLVDSSGGQTLSVLLGCSSGEGVADATRHGPGWLVATSNGEFAPAACASPGGAGPPTRIDVFRVTIDGLSVAAGAMERPMPVTTLAVAGHPDGAYVVWRETSDEGGAPVRWARFDVGQSAFVGSGEVSAPGELPLDFAATALGERLAVAYTTESGSVNLRVQDQWGGAIASASFNFQASGQLAMIAAPSGRSLVVALRDAGSVSNISLIRHDCMP